MSAMLLRNYKRGCLDSESSSYLSRNSSSSSADCEEYDDYDYDEYDWNEYEHQRECSKNITE